MLLSHLLNPVMNRIQATYFYQLDGPKIVFLFSASFVLVNVSRLTTCAMITSRMLLPYNFTSVNFGGLHLSTACHAYRAELLPD